MAKSNIYREFNFTLQTKGQYNLEFFPFKMQNLEVFNTGPNDALAMPNDAGTANAITVVANGVRTFSSDEPFFERINFYSFGGTTIRVVATR